MPPKAKPAGPPEGGSLHEGHRNRLRERFIATGLDSFDDHTVLELLLFHAIPRRDTNELAHLLLREFGSLSQVMDAPHADLCRVAGMTRNAATLLKLIPAASRRYLVSRTSRDKSMDSVEKIGDLLLPHFFGVTRELVMVVCLDSRRQLIGHRIIAEGTVNFAAVQPRMVIEIALAMNAVAVVLAHNHPSGVALPSQDDYACTRRLTESMAAVGIPLLDHIIVADDDYVSMAQSGFFR